LKFCILLSIVNPIGVEKNKVKRKSLSCGFANFATDIGKKKEVAQLESHPHSVFISSPKLVQLPADFRYAHT